MFPQFKYPYLIKSEVILVTALKRVFKNFHTPNVCEYYCFDFLQCHMVLNRVHPSLSSFCNYLCHCPCAQISLFVFIITFSSYGQSMLSNKEILSRMTTSRFCVPSRPINYYRWLSASICFSTSGNCIHFLFQIFINKSANKRISFLLQK